MGQIGNKSNGNSGTKIAIVTTTTKATMIVVAVAVTMTVTTTAITHSVQYNLKSVILDERIQKQNTFSSLRHEYRLNTSQQYNAHQ